MFTDNEKEVIEALCNRQLEYMKNIVPQFPEGYEEDKRHLNNIIEKLSKL